MRWLRWLVCMMIAVPLSAQTVTPNLGMTLPLQGQQNWGSIINNDLTIIDTFSATTATFPSSLGLVYATAPKLSRTAVFSDVVGLFGSGSCTGYLNSNGTCSAIAGGLSSFTSGPLSPLFTTSLGSAPTSTPALTFTLSTVPAGSVFGNFTGSTTTPAYSTAPVFSAAGLTNFPTLNQNTTGNAATATAFSATPALCSTGQAPTGIMANGNAAGCSGTVNAATALASTPTQCPSGQVATGIAASGNANCTPSGVTTTRTCNSNGCYRVEGDGTIEQWGATSCSSNACAITFPTTFTTTTNLSIQPTIYDPSCTGITNVLTVVATTGFTDYSTGVVPVGGGGCSYAGGGTMHWHAIGN